MKIDLHFDFKKLKASFFVSNSATLMELQPAARLRLELLRIKTASKISDDLENYKSIALDVNINAPKILIPENILVKETPVLLIDLGRIAIRNESRIGEDVNTTEINSMKEKIEKMSMPELNEQLKKRNVVLSGAKSILVARLLSLITTETQKDPNNIDALYDKFKLRLSSLQIVMSPNGNVFQII